jgi:hypothetical protein
MREFPLGNRYHQSSMHFNPCPINPLRAGNAGLCGMYLDSHVTCWTKDGPHQDAYTQHALHRTHRFTDSKDW